MYKDHIPAIMVDEDFEALIETAWSYSVHEPMVCKLHMWADAEAKGPKDNVWIVGRELIAECIIDGKPHVGEGEILVLYKGPHYTSLLLSNEDIECFEIKFQTRDLLRVLDLTYLQCSRQEETEKTMNIVLGQFDNLLRNSNAI